jgi:hypothetical protein
VPALACGVDGGTDDLLASLTPYKTARLQDCNCRVSRSWTHSDNNMSQSVNTAKRLRPIAKGWPPRPTLDMNADHHVTRNGLSRFDLIAFRATQPLAGLPNLGWGRGTRVGRGGQPFAMGRNRFAVLARTLMR